MNFIKEHLLVQDYAWNTDSKHTTLSDGPTRNRFDRFDGFCMLHMINLYHTCVQPLTIEQAQNIERLIQGTLPLEAKSEVSVLNWLKEKKGQIFTLEVV